jgi:hypothetical protein
LRRLHENMRRLRCELWRQRNWLLHHDNALTRTSFFTRESLVKTTWLSSPTHPTFLCSPNQDKAKRPPYLHNWGDRGRIVGGAEYPQNTTSGMH